MQSTRSSSLAALAVTLGLFAALVAPMVLSRAGYAPPAWDEEIYHLPIIRTMAQQWPSVDIVKYDSATTPGYHVVMAGVLKATDSVMAMRGLNALLSAGLIAAVFASIRSLAPGRHAWLACALTLPLVTSQYFLGGAIWLTTDNTALLFVVLALWLGVLARTTPGRNVAAGALSALAVVVRQLHIWIAAPIVLASMVASPLARLAPRFLREDRAPETRSWTSLITGLVAAALAFGTLGLFVWLWGGLLPVTQKVRDQHLQGLNPATWPFALSLCALLGVFFLSVGHGHGREVIAALRARAGLTLAVVLAGLASALVFPTHWVDRVRDTGPVWKLVKIAPAPMGRSVVLAVLAPIGAVILLLLWKRASDAGRRVTATLVLFAMIAWLAAQTANIMCWHRYFEPLLLIMLAWLAAMGAKEKQSWRTWIGPIVLAMGLLALSAVTLYLPAIKGIQGTP